MNDPFWRYRGGVVMCPDCARERAEEMNDGKGKWLPSPPRPNDRCHFCGAMPDDAAMLALEAIHQCIERYMEEHPLPADDHTRALLATIEDITSRPYRSRTGGMPAESPGKILLPR